MKKFLNSVLAWLIILLIVPIVIVLGIGYLFFVPFDIIRYHRMPYYKDFKNKYTFFITSRDAVKFYNRIARENLPIEYIQNNNFEYFVKDEQVLLCNWDYDGFEQVDGVWFFVFDGKCSTKMSMEEIIENERDLLKPEHKNLPVKFLFFYQDITDAEKFEQAKECPYLYCVFLLDEWS